jgi:hypothetical protein
MGTVMPCREYLVQKLANIVSGRRKKRKEPWRNSDV